MSKNQNIWVRPVLPPGSGRDRTPKTEAETPGNHHQTGKGVR